MHNVMVVCSMTNLLQRGAEVMHFVGDGNVLGHE